MLSNSLLATTSASSLVQASGLAAQFKSIVPSDLFISLGLGFVIGIIIAIVYRKTYRGVLYSPSFTLTLIMLTLITTPVVMCIKSDIALSMGMVGALSIVRFRTAVKDPLDTAYMFWALTMGILLGAGQFFLTAVTVVGIAVLITLLVQIQSKGSNSFLLVVRMGEGAERAAAQVVGSIRNQKLKSKTISANGIEATWEVRLDKPDAVLNKLRAIPGMYDATLVSYTGEVA